MWGDVGRCGRCEEMREMRWYAEVGCEEIDEMRRDAGRCEEMRRDAGRCAKLHLIE